MQTLEKISHAGELTHTELDPFDSTTLLGRYFRFSVHSVVNNTLSAPLSTHDIAQLESDFPELYAELKGLTTYLSHAAETEKIAALETLLTHAESQGWPRLVRWFSALLVELEMETGNYGHALFRLYEEIDFAPEVELNDTHFEYPKSLMLRDMAATLYYLGEYEKSLDYCQRFAASLTDTGEGELQGTLCEIRAQIRLGQHDVALASLETLPTDSIYAPYAFTASLLHAEALLESERLKEAKNLGEKAHALLNEKPNPQSDDIFDVSLLLAQIHLKLGHREEAAKYAVVAEQSMGLLENGKHHVRGLLRTKGEIAEAQGDFDSALQIYERLYNIENSTIPSFPWKKIEEISSKLDFREIEYLRRKAELNQEIANYLVTALVMLLLISLFFMTYYMSLKIRKSKKLKLKNNCHFTQLQKFEFFKLNISSKLKNKKTNAVVFLDDSCISPHAISLNEKILISEYLKEKISKLDVIGRYDIYAIVIFFNDTNKEEAFNKVNILLKEYAKVQKRATTSLSLERKNFVASQCKDELSVNEAFRLCEEKIEKIRFDDKFARRAIN
ncbi:tetratricopeptide repeat protein [Alteromonas ponticola]|uniref:Tetratricopeptide repeat protein n=1 Tax=Alteromonas ponticola TaxID=2720613 RepID=A0ABX1R5Y9_9ALTE|nr:tetratricopeptide repeat protein [Alteromonas ponticola]NMH60906.1 tetratricopeptide repeat protein [Alteromonas ponticola]